MFETFGAVGLPLIAAAMHPFLGRFIQNGTKQGVNVFVIVGVANILTALIFLLYLRADLDLKFSKLDVLACINGAIFFFGQFYSIKSVRSGDIAVHSSALGVKILVIAVSAEIVGLESDRPFLIPAAVTACAAVFLVAGANLSGWRDHRTTVGLTLLACLFFGVNDFMTGWKAQDLGSARWLTLMMLTAGLLSFGLLAQRVQHLREISWFGAQGRWTVLAGVTLGVQALLVNIAFSHFQEPTLSNVAYSTRGVLAVVFLWVIGEPLRTGSLTKRFTGAALMIVALILALQST